MTRKQLFRLFNDAARAADRVSFGSGATAAQFSFIAGLVGNRDIVFPASLTKREASAMIDDLKGARNYQGLDNDGLTFAEACGDSRSWR